VLGTRLLGHSRGFQIACYRSLFWLREAVLTSLKLAMEHAVKASGLISYNRFGAVPVCT
jgi:hypothetical protein